MPGKTGKLATAVSLLLCSSLTAAAGSSIPPGATGARSSAPVDTVRRETAAARQCYQNHDYAGAADHYQGAVKAGQSLPPRTRIVLYSNLGAAYREAHKLPESQGAFRQAITIAEQAHIETDKSAVMAMHQYAVLLRKLGQNMDAELMDARANGVTSPATNPAAGSGAKIMLAEPETPPIPQTGAAIPEVKDPSNLNVDQLKQVVDEHQESVAAWYYLAKKYVQLKDWPNAISALRTIIQKFPKEGQELHENLAYCLEKNGQTDDAIDETKRAIEIHPNESKLYLRLHGLYIDTGKVADAIDIDKTFIEKFPDDPQYSTVASALKILQTDTNRGMVSEESTQPKASERKKSWPAKMMPLKVFIAAIPEDNFRLSASAVGMSEQTPADVIRDACTAWNQASQGRITFEFVDRLEDANIDIQFTNNPAGMEDSAAAGVTSWSAVGGQIKAHIMLVVSEQSSNTAYKPEEVMETSLHEMGHALGLDHSTSVSDVMYPSNHGTPVYQLSANDSRRVVALYTN